jgi:hypothetical protein
VKSVELKVNKEMLLRLIGILVLVAGAGVVSEAKPRWQGCLPSDLNASDVIGTEPEVMGQRVKQLTVASKLNQLKARCVGKRLVDAKGKQIQFFRLVGCWGNPPENYEEILNNQQQELAKLRRRYRVIEISCNTSGVMIQ